MQAIATPIFFTGVSLFYLEKFHYTTPHQSMLLLSAHFSGIL